MICWQNCCRILEGANKLVGSRIFSRGFVLMSHISFHDISSSRVSFLVFLFFVLYPSLLISIRNVHRVFFSVLFGSVRLRRDVVLFRVVPLVDSLQVSFDRSTLCCRNRL